jgi:putative addiction module CopG family antidote
MAKVVCGEPAPPYGWNMDGMTLPAELEHYADEAVAAGRFRDRSEVVAAGLRLLQQTDAEVAEFVQSLEEARTEAERDGWIGLDDMTATMDRILRETADRAA